MTTNLLKNWSFERCTGGVVVVGTVYNDIKGRFPDGTLIHTSMVLQADFVNGVIETRNSVYHLDMHSHPYT